MSASNTADPYLSQPLDGVRLIEASAGTGKTFTLATLFTRLVVERGLRCGQILAVTFTEAATQELRRRIRERLALALTLVPEDAAQGLAAAAEDSGGTERELTRSILAAHLAASTETAPALRRRLRQAVEEIDLAAIFTIHGFCARVLREHALDSGQTFAAPELGNERELLAEVAADLWRMHGGDAAQAAQLLALWPGGVQAMAPDLRELLRQPVLLPALPPAESDADAATLQAVASTGRALAAAWQDHGSAFFAAIHAAITDGVLNKGQYKAEWLADLRQWCEAFASASQAGMAPHDKLEKLTVSALQAGTKKNCAERTPQSSLSQQIDAYLQAYQALQKLNCNRRSRLLHALREQGRARLAQFKRQRRVQCFDDLVEGVARALQSTHAQDLARRLREQYAIALVDEFQDTDDRQWSIFANVFGQGELARALGLAPALFLIGDPKQAIYGFRGGDVQTYLAAAATAEQAPALDRNFRSRPGVLKAIDALYAQAGYASAFLTKGIAFRPVQPGTQRADSDLQRAGINAPALTLWQAPLPLSPDGKRKPWSAGMARELCTKACVAAIADWLRGGAEGSATLNGRALQAADIAVLVRSHHEASCIQQALAAVGIAAVAAGKCSLFASAEALELLTLLQALLDPGDDRRLRAALATVLIGEDAAAIAALDHAGDRQRDWQQQGLDWRERWQRSGPLALVTELCAAQAQRLLCLIDGERRLTNYLQLAELLQEADARALGPQGLVDWLSRRIANADDNDEAQQLRLESDARRVQIVTLHKSKGLEYPLVFLPYVGIGRKQQGPGRNCVVTASDGSGRQLHWRVDKDDEVWAKAAAEWSQEQRAEDARLLYVGLTRAEHALWIAHGEFFQHQHTALAAMVAAPQQLQQALGAQQLAIDKQMPASELPRLAAAAAAQVPAARLPQRRVAPDWWVYSFTQLANADAGAGNDPLASATVVSGGGGDEPSGAAQLAVASASEEFDPRFAGNRFGVVMHAAFECCDFAAWQHWRAGQAAPGEQAAVIAQALRGGGYAERDLDDGIAMLTPLIGHSLCVQLPEGTTLAMLPASARRNEMEFHFAMRPTAVSALLALLHRYGVVSERQAFGSRQRLEGLMTGLIDLTYQHDGRWYVLDYKSNRLPSYDADALTRAMAHSEYELQALIYTVALHRWLGFRLGADYDYARHFGGVRYLFCRGLDSACTPSPGVQAWRFEPALVQALDELFAGSAEPSPSAAITTGVCSR